MIESNTKQRIFDIAVRLFSDKGYKNVSMRDIAQVAGIKAASIYNHFESKAKILEDLFSFFFEQQKKYMPDLDQLLVLAESEPLELLFDRFNYHFPGVEQTMARIMIIAGMEYRNDEKSETFMKNLFFDMPRIYVGGLLDKLIEFKRIEPIDTEAFCFLFSSFLYSGAMHNFSKFSVSLSLWDRAWKIFFGFIKPI
ncbi:MAG: TetR/AcrR family transcriptional regulator [Clostridiales bacterium]|jgi:AcrR family transcriptional regulator|nr:TetR/AcrR family transcriptional regulator [Clostridiales bacterium]